jgi:hypothetical protein
VSPAASVRSRHHSDGDGGAGSTATAVITQALAASTETDSVVEEQQEQEQEKEGQEWEEMSSGGGGGGFPPSRQPDAPIPTSTIQLLESGMISERQSPEAVPDHHPGTQSASRIGSPTREAACTRSGPCVGIQDITFLHVEGERETARGPEYLFVGKTWLRPGAGVPSDLLQVYRREVVRKDRLATLRTRKRTSEEVDLVKATRCPARKKVKRTQL